MVTVNAITAATVITMVIIGPPFRPKVDSTARCNGSWCVRTLKTSWRTPLQPEIRVLLQIDQCVVAGNDLSGSVMHGRSNVVTGKFFAALQEIQLDGEA
jgi:hypothetical protein